QHLLLLPELCLGISAYLIDDCERSRKLSTATQADQIRAARHHVQCIDDEITVICNRLGNFHTKEILSIDPEDIIEDISVSDNDHIQVAFAQNSGIVDETFIERG